MTDSPDHLHGQDVDEQWHQSFNDESDTDQEDTDNHGPAAAVEVGYDARRYLENKNGNFQ